MQFPDIWEIVGSSQLAEITAIANMIISIVLTQRQFKKTFFYCIPSFEKLPPLTTIFFSKHNYYHILGQTGLQIISPLEIVQKAPITNEAVSYHGERPSML